MDPRNLLLYGLALIIALFGLVVYARRDSLSSHRLFGFLCLGVVTWLVGIATFRSETNAILEQLSLYGIFVGPAVVGTLFLPFAYQFPRPIKSPSGVGTIVGFAALLLLIIIATPQLLWTGVSGIASAKLIQYQPLGLGMYAVLLLALMLGGFYVLIARYRSSKGVEHLQLSYFIAGSSLSFGVSVVTNLWLPMYGVNQFGWVGPASMLLWLGFLGVAVYTTRLFDLRFIIRRTLVYTMLLALTLSAYSLLVLELTNIIGPRAEWLAVVIIGLSFEPLRRALLTASDQIYFPGDYRAHELLRDISWQLNHTVDLTTAAQAVFRVIAPVFSPTVLALVIPDPHGDRVIGLGSSQLNQQQVIELVRDRTTPLVAAADTEAGGLALLYPLLISRGHTPHRLVGVLCLGPRSHGAAYTRYDLEFIDGVAFNLATAIDRGRFYEEDILKNEFISIASHDLMTPIAAVKGYLSLILDDRMGKIDQQAKTYLQRVNRSVVYMTTLVTDLLNVSRIELERVQMHPFKTNIADVMEVVAEDLRPLIDAKSLQLNKKLTRQQAWVDTDRLRELLTNVLSNAIKFTPERGNIWITLSRMGQEIVLCVKDSGIGIPPADLRRIGGKFFRATNTDNISGTGLGLFIVNNYIRRMGGNVLIKSTLGKGTTVELHLPLLAASGSIKS